MPPYDSLPPYIPPVDTLADSAAIVGPYDSLFIPLGKEEPVVRKSLFTGHELPAHDGAEGSLTLTTPSGWPFFFFLLSILLVCLFLRSKQLRLVDVLQSAVDYRVLDRTLRDTNLTHSSDQAPIALLMLMPLVLVVYGLAMPPSGNTWIDIGYFLLITLGCTLVYFLRNGLIRFLGNAFQNPESVHLYLSSNYLFHLLYAITAIAVGFLVLYGGSARTFFLYLLGGLLGLLFLVRLVRGMALILTNSKTPKFYLFYYLCILEIVPIIIVLKVAISV